MTRARSTFAALALATTACSPEPETTERRGAAASPVPTDIAAIASAAAPGITITSGELSNDQYEVTGTLSNGQEVELDLVQSNGTWTVLEIQRDVAWSSVPAPVRAAAAAAPDSFEPVRVIESTQTADGSIVYELFRVPADGGPSRGPAMEVRWHEGLANVIP